MQQHSMMVTRPPNIQIPPHSMPNINVELGYPELDNPHSPLSNTGSSPHGSPLNSPVGSSPSSDYPLSPNPFSQSTLQPPSSSAAKMSSNTFVHKLYNMVVDKQYQHLIAWNYTGNSFIVCNIMEFSRDVLPKHFKHNNFSSFVRQLNMYGFHKVNKSPRGHRTLAENQIWEFSHPKFVRNRSDLLDDIKRKAMESETLRRETGDLHAHMAMMQVAQSDMIQQIAHLQENFSEVVRELAETKRKQGIQQQLVKNILDYMQQQGGNVPMPPELNFDNYDIKPEPDRPPIYITSPESSTANNMLQNLYYPMQSNSSNVGQTPVPQRPSAPLTVQTQGLRQSQTNFLRGMQLPANYLSNSSVGNQPPLSPNSLNAYHAAVNTPLPPSPSPTSPLGTLGSDDDMDASSLYNPHSPGGHSSYGSDGDQDGNMSSYGGFGSAGHSS